MFNNKNILITGGAGSFGKSLIEYLLKNFKPRKIVIYSRDELKQSQMISQLQDNLKNKILRFLLVMLETLID